MCLILNLLVMERNSKNTLDAVKKKKLNNNKISSIKEDLEWALSVQSNDGNLWKEKLKEKDNISFYNAALLVNHNARLSQSSIATIMKEHPNMTFEEYVEVLNKYGHDENWKYKNNNSILLANTVWLLCERYPNITYEEISKIFDECSSTSIVKIKNKYGVMENIEMKKVDYEKIYKRYLLRLKTPGIEVKINGQWIEFCEENESLIKSQNPMTLEFRFNRDLLDKYNKTLFVPWKMLSIGGRWHSTKKDADAGKKLNKK